MPTTYTDQFFIIDPYSPPPAGTAMNFSIFDLIDQNDDGDIDRFDNDSVDGQDVTSSWPGDTVTIDIGGGTLITYIGTTFYLADGRQVFTPTDGQVLQNGILDSASGVTTQGPLDVNTDLGPACFVQGTWIETPRGDCRIETLNAGDLITTLNGPQPLMFLASGVVEGRGDFAPIRFSAGAVGNSKPLLVSPQHRMLLSGWQAQLYFGQDEVLVAAKHLTNGDTIRRAPQDEVTYFHLLFEGHQIVFGNGVPSESFDPFGESALQNREILTELREVYPAGYPNLPTARTVLRRREALVLAA